MKKEIKRGILAFFSLLLFYFLVMGILSRSLEATIIQFEELWYWIIALAAGFGVQFGLYTHLKEILKIRNQARRPAAVATTSAGASSVSMVACCAHHLTEVLAIMGLSGAAVFLTRYQIQLIISGLLINFFGILYMLRVIKQIKS